MKNKIEEKIGKFIKETEVSNLVAPELNVDRDRDEWLRKMGKKETTSSKCVLCKRPLRDNPSGPDNPDDEHYTHLGGGPYCEKCYEKMQAKDDELSREGRMSGMQAAGVGEVAIPRKRCRYCGKIRPSYLMASHEKTCPKNPKVMFNKNIEKHGDDPNI